jgi:hypothetical protein
LQGAVRLELADFLPGSLPTKAIKRGNLFNLLLFCDLTRFAYRLKQPAALNIYRHEEIERLIQSGYASRDPGAKGKARKIADGALDRKKQSALYVAITRHGAVGVHPGLITREDAESEIKRAERLSEMPDTFLDQYRELKKILPLVFSGSLKESQKHAA